MRKLRADYIDKEDGYTLPLEQLGVIPQAAHVFEGKSIHALNAALAARRPLLVCGEPGTGKSQLARAAAQELRRTYIPFVVDSRTEARDLLWRFDAVARLTKAQTLGALGAKEEEIRQQLETSNFVHPGPLWWAFNWQSALDRAKKVSGRQHESPFPQADDADPERGCVVLIDEIDKAESDVPNGLLEALGAGQFQPEGQSRPVAAQGRPPLVLITSNGERALPDAFLRRCLVLFLELPSGKGFAELMVVRGKSHFPDLADPVLSRAAEIVGQDREAAKGEQVGPIPGQAEYLDLLRAVDELEPDDEKAQLNALDRIAAFALGKRRINQL